MWTGISENKEIFLFLVFLYSSILYVFFSCFIALGKSHNTIWIRCWHPCLFPDISRNDFTVLSLSVIFALGFR